MAESTRWVAYYRVSTAKQGITGLGMDAQRAAVAGLVASKGGKIVAEFSEQESGRIAARPELLKALAACKNRKAVLVIAKLDRLARNAHFLLGLRDAGVEFVAADMPDANRLTVGILALVAEDETRAISERTKAALAAAKARGTKLGSDREGAVRLDKAKAAMGNAKSAEARGAIAKERAANLGTVLMELRQRHSSLAQIAKALNEDGYSAPRGGEWKPVQVSRVLDKLKKLEAA
jgi:DNA invertase Pin-like site-specific DNA recombinase